MRVFVICLYIVVGAGFISTENFSQLLGNLGLVSDPD